MTIMTFLFDQSKQGVIEFDDSLCNILPIY